MKLYELDNEYLNFIAAVEDGTIPEDAIEDTLEMLNGDYKDKLDNTVCAIKNLTAEAKMIDEEIKALTARKKAKENSVDYLKSCVSRSMQCRGETSFESARNKVAFRKSERLVIADEAAFVEKYPEFVTFTPKISKTDVKTAVKSGESFDGADIVEVQNIQIKCGVTWTISKFIAESAKCPATRRRKSRRVVSRDSRTLTRCGA